jgi:flavodoxin
VAALRTLIAFYSRTGMNEKLAKLVQEKMGCDVESIVDLTNRNGVWGFIFGGLQAALKRKSKIQPVQKDPAGYDVVILVYPVWSKFMPPPIRTYIFENKSKFKEVALLSVSGDGSRNTRAISDFESTIGLKPASVLMLTEKELEQEDVGSEIGKFVESILAS